MKLIRCGEAGAEIPAVLLPTGERIDASAVTRDYDETFFGGAGMAELARWVDSDGPGARRLPPEARLGPPLARPSKIVCIGLNFRDHAAEAGLPIPPEPVIFFKATSAIAGPNDTVLIPRGGTKLDWEVELAVVIGRRAGYVAAGDAAAHIAGYVLHNDYSERTFQMDRGGQWVKGKSADTFAPLGPWIATADDVPDPGRLGMWLDVNGRRMQSGNSADMIAGCAALVAYVSQFMTLLPGDVISTGTPAGVGLGMKPEPVYLKAGDVVELGIDGLGSQRQLVADHPGGSSTKR